MNNGVFAIRGNFEKKVLDANVVLSNLIFFMAVTPEPQQYESALNQVAISSVFLSGK